MKVIFYLSFLLMLSFQAYAEEKCIAKGDRCDDRYDATPCCNEGKSATCMDPMYGLGFYKCRECRPEGSPCEKRTDCCTNCCSGGVCEQNWDTCNFTETITQVIAGGVLAVWCGCSCIIGTCACICIRMGLRNNEKRRKKREQEGKTVGDIEYANIQITDVEGK